MDESGIDIAEQYQYGWAKKNERLYCERNGKKAKRISMIAGLNDNNIVAPIFYEGYTDSISFEYWIRHHLCPILKPKMVIVLDNASFHKGKNIEKLIKACKCKLLFLPTYSPDLNPIEHKWFEIKHKIRKESVNLNNWQERISCGFKLSRLI